MLETDIIVFTEIPSDIKFPKTVHKVKLPKYNSPKWYITITSLNAFQNGKKRNATVLEKRNYQDRCCWSPHSLFYGGKSLSEWGKRCQELSEDFPHFSELDERTLEEVIHESLFDFYKYIGFNREKRKYVK